MRKLDRTRDFGTYKGAVHIPPSSDRPAFYCQDGLDFDAYDREIVAGETLEQSMANARKRRRLQEQATTAVATREVMAEAETLDAAKEILAGADKMPLSILRTTAKFILGPSCPAKKAEIVAALKAHIATGEASPEAQTEEGEDEDGDPDDAENAPLTPPEPGPHKGVSFASMEGGNGKAPAPKAPATAPPPAGPQPAKGPTTVDLAAWGRGQKDYVFGEVRKAIDTKYSRVVTERREAVDFLIDEGVITGAEARKDVRKETRTAA